MYDPSLVLRALREPHRIREELTRLRWRAYSRVQRLRGYQSPRMMERDWDTLVVLDACRYDIFADHHTLEGSLEPLYSIVSNTFEWLQKSFTGCQDSAMDSARHVSSR
jgi:hypothetical protein